MLTTFLIGVVLGGLWVGGGITAFCVVTTKKAALEDDKISKARHMRMEALAAENAHLRIALAAGQMTEEGKKIATMTMAALDAVMEAVARDEDLNGSLNWWRDLSPRKGKRHCGV